jgi:hypothetical protein
MACCEWCLDHSKLGFATTNNRFRFPDVLEKVASVKPRFLIGQDNQTLMLAREVVEPETLDLMITKTKVCWILHGGDNGGSIQEGIVNICCEERDDDLHDCVKNIMWLENFGVVVTNIDCRKPEEEMLFLKMMADTIQNVGERYEVALPYQNDVDPFPKSRWTVLHRLKCTERKLEKTE